MILTALFVLTVLAATLRGRLPPVIMMIYGVLSILTFLLYWHDKDAARRGNWRTPETSLLLIGLLGGWPGAVLAQRTLRHKTRKKEYQLAFWATAAMSSIALAWLLTDSGSNLTKQLLE